jgi:site-specific recombinase XerD
MTEQAISPSVSAPAINASVTTQAISPSVTTQAISPSVTTHAISPLRLRMIEDMAIRKFTAKTQHDYVQRVKDFATFLGRSPRTAESEDVRRFQLHLTAKGAGTPTINATVSALRFFFTVTLNRADLAKPLSSIHEPRKMPVDLAPRRWRVFWRRRQASNTRRR